MSDVIVAPFSNSAIRDWPADRFAELVGLLLEDTPRGTCIRVVGTAGQRLGANNVVRRHPADRVSNECGRMDWGCVLRAISEARCVIGNNSGLAHVAGYLGRPTVCIFGGSHQRSEWRPRGQNVVVLSRSVACSPCQLDHGSVSFFGKACLRDITAREVHAAARLAVERAVNGQDAERKVLSQ
jgi:ADP-heptose:LPS heptosyltransferase